MGFTGALHTTYGFTSIYTAASELEPGVGYWMRASTGGQITMTCVAGKQEAAQQGTPRGFAELVLTAPSGNPQSLFVGGKLPPGTHEWAYSVPPAAPGHVRQAQFDTGRLVAEYDHAVVPMTPEALPLVVSVRGTRETITVEQLAADGSRLGTLSLRPGDHITVSDARVAALVLSGAADSPIVFELEPAYPNPFNPTTTLRFSLPEAGPVRILAFDALGRRVVEIMSSDSHPAGRHEVQFDAGGLSSGLYLVRLDASGGSLVQMVLFMK